jgi:uncharacterized protein involved in exopolysaccharide biosynthesis/Mrp family chromosome partitioning ATPase
MEYISFDKFFKLLIKRWKIILYFTIGFILLSFLYLPLYSPTYVSESKVQLKQEDENTYVTQLTPDSSISTIGGQNTNPVLTQIEVLSSYDISLDVAESLSSDPEFSQFPIKSLAKGIQRNIKLANPPGTGIIDINVSWNNPANAQKIARALLDTYLKYNDSVYKKSVVNTKSYIENQLKDTNKKLFDIRGEIQKYRIDNASIDINMEAGSVITQISKIKELIADVDVNIATNQKRVNEFNSSLKIDVKNAVNSVALGQSDSLLQLNQKLTDDQQKLASLRVRYPETTPQLRSLNSEIVEIKNQIKNETIKILGKETIVAGKASVISDSVRSEMVADYVKNSIDLKSYIAQKNALQSVLNSLNQNQQKIPEMQRTLQNLQEQEKNLSDIVATLNSKLVEAKIKESAIVSNVNIVENPILPTQESFPTFFHIFVIFVLIGVLLGFATVLGLYYLEDICDNTKEIEEIIKAPVLGIIPWLTNSTYGNFLVDYNPHSVVAIIYQKIATSLKVKCFRKRFNSIGIISAELEKRRSIVAASLANTFAKSEDRVVLIDTDFRDGSLTREFNIDFSSYPDITDLMLDLTKATSDENFDEIISKYIVQIVDQKNLFLIPNNNKVNNPYEILNNDIFPKLIERLKANFDLVIVDSPPMLAVADSIITAQHVDGIAILCGIKTSRSNLRKIKKICDDNYIEILGAIARDTLTELEVPENMYIKQLSGNV